MSLLELHRLSLPRWRILSPLPDDLLLLFLSFRGVQIWTYDPLDCWIFTTSLSPSGEKLAITFLTHCTVYDTALLQPVQKLSVANWRVPAQAWSPSERFIVLETAPTLPIAVWDTESNQIRRFLPHFAIYDYCWLDDDRFLLASSDRLKIFHIDDGLKREYEVQSRAMALHPNREIVALLSQDQKDICFLDLRTGCLSKTSLRSKNERDLFLKLQWSPGGERIALSNRRRFQTWIRTPSGEWSPELSRTGYEFLWGPPPLYQVSQAVYRLTDPFEPIAVLQTQFGLYPQWARNGLFCCSSLHHVSIYDLTVHADSHLER